jgi:serine protease Do
VDKAMAVAANLLSINRIDDNWHGVTAKDSPDHEGLVVDSIEKDSPAADGGLQAGDVITSAAGQEIERPLDFEWAVLGHKAGEKIELAIERNQQPVKLILVLAAKPKAAKIDEDPNWELLGMKLTPIPPQQFRQYQSRYRGGLSVAAVRPDSPAAKQGIRRGDILVGMHVWETISLENVSYILNRPDFSDISPVKFYILRGSETLFGHLPVAMKKQ